MSVAFERIHEITISLLNRSGLEVIVPKKQVCCGALNLHRGENRVVKAMARKNIDCFLRDDIEAVIVNAAGCGAVQRRQDHQVVG